MAEFEVLVLGVGDSFSQQHHCSALLLSCDGFHLAVDCPDMYRTVLHNAAMRSGCQVALDDIDHVLITHVHGDHMNGLEGVAFYKHFAQQRRVQLVTSPEVRSVIWERRLAASMGQLWDGTALVPKTFEDFFEHTPLDWHGPIEVGPFRICSRATRHHVPTSALMVEAGGVTLGYSSDTAFDPDLIDFLAPADLIIHETNLGPAHTAYMDLAALPQTLRQRMRLIHYPDAFDGRHSAIAPLVEGNVLQVGKARHG